MPALDTRYAREFLDLSKPGPMGCDGLCTGVPGECQAPEHRIIRPEDVHVFPCSEDGTIHQLDGDMQRERFFRLTQQLVPCLDLGVRLLCKHCPHVLHQHGARTSSTSAACQVANCRCMAYVGSDCGCSWGSGGGHRVAYRRWCHACKVRDSEYRNVESAAPYDDRAWSEIVGRPGVVRR